MRRSSRWTWVAAAAVSGVLLAAPAFADAYGYTDESGSYHVVDGIHRVPPAFRETATRIRSARPKAPERSPARPSRPVDRGTEVIRFGEDGTLNVGGATAERRGGSANEVFIDGKFVSLEPGEPEEPVAAPAPTTEPTDANGESRYDWQRKVVEWANKRARYREQIAHLEANKRVLAYGRPTEKSQYRRDLAEAREGLAEAETMLDETLPREAERAGADPSWLELPGLE